MTVLKTTGLVVAIGLLSACATKAQPTNQTTTATPATQSKSAKEALSLAVKSQLYRSFGYQTDIYVSNHPKRQAEPELGQESAIDVGQCEREHDEAYVALLKKARLEQGKKLDLNKIYPDEQKSIKSSYQACMTKAGASKSAFEPFDFDEFYEQTHALSADEKAQMFMLTSSAMMATQSVNSIDNSAQEDPALALKKAQLMDAYLLKPSHVSVFGRYHPLKGQFSALPSLSYDAKNLHLSVNQPILLDMKAGGIYLWADNFALANSQFLDKRLGDKWHNKWLFLPFDDGSLPKDFAKDFLKAYLNAKKESFVAMESHGFVWTTSDELLATAHLSSNLPNGAKTTITHTPSIIKYAPSAKDKGYSDYVFYEVLYNTLIKQHPDLAIEQALGYNPHTTERDIVDGESVITVRNADDSTQAPTEPKMNTKMLITLWLSGINQKVQSYYESQHHATQGDESAEGEKYRAVTHYGLNGSRLSWVLQRHELNQQIKGGQLTKVTQDKPMVVDVFTRLYDDPTAVKGFDALPAPNAQNSVNLLTYKEEFLAHLKNSNDEYLQTVLGLLLGSDEVKEPSNQTPDDDEPAIAVPAN